MQAVACNLLESVSLRSTSSNTSAASSSNSSLVSCKCSENQTVTGDISKTTKHTEQLPTLIVG